MKAKAAYLFAIIAGLACLLSGCRMIALPGREPFGEQTQSDDRARSVYEDVRAEMEQIDFSDWGGYSIEMHEGTVSDDFYRTEEYTVAWHEGAQDYLWYQGRLYCVDGEALAYREAGWEELQLDDYVEQQWEFACALLAREAERLEYKYIPLASGKRYLLTAEYQETDWNGQARRFPGLFFRLDEDGDFSSFALRWQEGGGRVVNVSCFPCENSVSLQAERKIWSFAHGLGLIEDGVPALSAQEEDREGCRSAIAGIDFDSILEQADYQGDLTFPVPPERGS